MSCIICICFVVTWSNPNWLTRSSNQKEGLVNSFPILLNCLTTRRGYREVYFTTDFHSVVNQPNQNSGMWCGKVSRNLRPVKFSLERSSRVRQAQKPHNYLIPDFEFISTGIDRQAVPKRKYCHSEKSLNMLAS
jgi:hypothetical protein